MGRVSECVLLQLEIHGHFISVHTYTQRRINSIQAEVDFFFFIPSRTSSNHIFWRQLRMSVQVLTHPCLFTIRLGRVQIHLPNDDWKPLSNVQLEHHSRVVETIMLAYGFARHLLVRRVVAEWRVKTFSTQTDHEHSLKTPTVFPRLYETRSTWRQVRQFENCDQNHFSTANNVVEYRSDRIYTRWSSLANLISFRDSIL